MKKGGKSKPDRSARVLLVGAEDEENLSIRYLAAVLEEKGHVTEIASCSREGHIKSVIRRVASLKPDIVGISIAFQSLSDVFFSLVCELRKSGYRGHIVVGGHFPTFDYRRILETQAGIDSVGRFEGEKTIVALADSIVSGLPLSAVPNLVYRASDGIRENECLYEFPVLDELPFPKRGKKPQVRLGERFATLVASRGCWHSSCLYCCIGAFHSKKKGKRFDLRSPENIAREIRDLYNKKGVRLFQFHDDNFMLPTKEETVKRFTGLKDALEKEGIDLKRIAFLIKARPDSIDENVASALSGLGVVGVFLGVENASETGLRALIRRTSPAEINIAISSLRKFGIIATYNLLIFHPAATLDEINDNISFMREHIYLPSDFGRAEVVSASPLENTLVQNNALSGSWPHWNYEIRDELVEKMFEINCLSFRRKNSFYSQMIESVIALAYQAYAVKRLHPGPVTDEIVREVDNLVIEINLFVIDKLMETYDLTLKNVREKDVTQLYEDIRAGCRRHLGSIRKINRRLHNLQTAEHIFDSLEIGGEAQNNGFLKSLLLKGMEGHIKQ